MVGKLIASLGRRRHWVQALAALLIFGSGLVVGSAGTFVALKEKIHTGRGFRPGRGNDDGKERERFVGFMTRDWQPRYNLTDDQINQVKTALLKNFETLGEIFVEAENKAAALEKPLLKKMGKIMSDEQYGQWLKDYQEQKRWREGRRGRRGERREGDRGDRREGDRDRREGPGGEPWRDDRGGPGRPPRMDPNSMGPEGPQPNGPEFDRGFPKGAWPNERLKQQNQPTVKDSNQPG